MPIRRCSLGPEDRNGIAHRRAPMLNDLGAKPNDTVGSWILGFWSGLNAANNALRAIATTASGVVGEVKLYCTAHPSAGLAQATVFDTYGG